MAKRIEPMIPQISTPTRVSFLSLKSIAIPFCFFLIFTLFPTIFSPSQAVAQSSVTLAWDPVSGASGYTVYVGTSSRSYTTHYDAHAATSLKIPGLYPGIQYYFAVAAYSPSGQYSPYSDEVTYTIGLNTTPITGQKIGVFRKISGLAYWYFDNNGSGNWDGCGSDGCFGPFGGYPEDIPVIGNWDGTGIPKLGIYRKGEWFFDPNNSGTWNGCGIDECLAAAFGGANFGGANEDFPVVGDWNGNGRTKIGIYRKGQWFLDLDGNGQWDQNFDIYIPSFGGFPEDIPIIGDWTGDQRSKIGIYRKGMWYLDKNGNGIWDGCQIDFCLGPFGGLDVDFPVVGDWTNTGISRIGIFRNGEWYFDFNGNGQWDDCTAGKPDRCAIPFGGSGDYPVVR